MIKQYKALVLIFLGLFLYGCSIFQRGKRNLKKDDQEEMISLEHEDHFSEVEQSEWRNNDENNSNYNCCIDYRKYKGSRTHEVDLLHTRLYVSFDWSKRYLYGKADLILKPYFYPIDSVHIDAKGFLIHRVGLIRKTDTLDLTYFYDSLKLHVALPRQYKAKDTFRLFISYTARPEELSFEGSSAIVERKGLYFINPEGKDPLKPRQIWTQGETEASSCWFPTIDSPNERTTQEIWITVDSQYVTLSNGILISSQYNNDGTRTDYWRMDLPHAPYLFMMAIGNFVKVTDQWHGKEVSYYVEPEYAPYARAIFGRTPEMIQFYSDYLKVPFPWPKYAQVVVRDFVSGAMENTTATVHMEALQQTARELLDRNYEEYIAHELFHQWFGDYVTCESWAHITLNEGFATYGEYLWKEYKEGRWAADAHLAENLATYLWASGHPRPLIRYYYKDQEEVFDAHSYQKGGCVLHMLRHYVGDEAFREALHLYLTQNAFKSVELANLRLAFEEVTGKDLRWFFDQWYLRPGHPILNIQIDTLSPTKVRISIVQTQKPPASDLYFLPTEIVLYTASDSYHYPIWIQSKDTQFVYELKEPITNVDVDPYHILLAVREIGKPLEYWKFQLENGESFGQVREAIEHLTSYLVTDPDIEQKFIGLLFHPYHGIRARALTEIITAYQFFGSGEEALPEPVFHKIIEVAKNDSVPTVKALALDALVLEEIIEDTLHPWRSLLIPLFEANLYDSSYQVSASALNGLYLYDRERALIHLPRLMKDARNELYSTIVDILVEEKDTSIIDFLEKHRNEVPDLFSGIRVYQSLAKMAKDGSRAFQQKVIAFLKEQAMQSGLWWKRYFPFVALKELADLPEVKTFLEQELAKPENKAIRKRLQ